MLWDVTFMSKFLGLDLRMKQVYISVISSHSVLTILVLSLMPLLCQHSVYTQGIWDWAEGYFFNLHMLDKLCVDLDIASEFLMSKVPTSYPSSQTH
jgi:hypothetical protein